MNNPSNKKGFALVDILAAIVIFGIATALIANILTLLLRGHESILVAEDKTTAGLLITREIENKVLDFDPTNVSLCDGEDQCIIFERQYEYRYNSDTGVVEKVFLSTYEQLVIRFQDDQIEIGDSITNTSPYSIHSDSNATITYNDFTTTVHIHIWLEDNLGIISEFIAMYSIPVDNQ